MMIQRQWFDAIKCGSKTVEGRLYDDKRKNIKVGGNIIFFNGTDSVAVSVIGVILYSSFRHMLNCEGIENVLPGMKNIDDGIQLYYSFSEYMMKESQGILAIRFRIIS